MLPRSFAAAQAVPLGASSIELPLCLWASWYPVNTLLRDRARRCISACLLTRISIKTASRTGKQEAGSLCLVIKTPSKNVLTCRVTAQMTVAVMNASIGLLRDRMPLSNDCSLLQSRDNVEI